jgi:Protein of unknown function (DUF1616)
VNPYAVTRRPNIHLLDIWGSVTLLALLWVYLDFGGTSLLGELLAVPLVLLIPGGLLVMMLPGRPKDPFFQFALAVGLSIAICIGVGLLLNVLPTGIDHQTWACTLGLVSTAEAVVVAILRSRAAKTRSSSPRMPVTQIDAKRVIVAAIATVAVLGGLVAIVSWERSNAKGAYRQERFAEVWVEPASGGAPVVGVRSDISGRNRFRLSLSEAGHTFKDYAFTLERQQTWSQKISIAPSATSRVLISLFNGSSSQPSERVWYNPSPGA